MESHSVLGKTYLNLGEKRTATRSSEPVTAFTLPPPTPRLQKYIFVHIHDQMGRRAEIWGESERCAASSNTSLLLREPGEPVSRARRGTVQAEPARRLRRLRREPERPSRERGQKPHEGSSTDGGPPVPPQPPTELVEVVAGTRPPHRCPAGPPTALHAIHPPSPHPSPPPHPSLRLFIVTSSARSLSLDLGPPLPQHTSPATTRPTCRRGHFSTGPRLRLFKEEMSFRFSGSRVPALLSFTWPMGWPMHPAPPLASEFRVPIGHEVRKAFREM